MDISDLLNDLNDAQRHAVTAPLGSTLILAGAGSGKTRVLTHRIAWLIRMEGLSPHQILAVTFTNKAAAEMKGRIEQLLNQPIPGMWVGTFHGLCHRFLRYHYEQAKLPEHFQIIDSEDQYRLIRRVMKANALNESKWKPRQVQWFINNQKDQGIRSPHVLHNGDFFIEQQQKIYQAYEESCQRSGLVDFAELLLRCHETLRDNDQLLNHYQHRFRSLLIDEFQDTNTVQYAWLRLLAGEESKIFAVGDDDQSIYGWRGAKIEHMEEFQQHYPQTELIKLEQNYRSTNTILAAANALIQNNPDRLGKSLWSDLGEGETIRLYNAFNEIDEARFVAEDINRQIDDALKPNEVAILYRSNAQSRLLEEALIRCGIPYRIYGGLRFFERAEIKDALAYLRLMTNSIDDASFERIVNTPTRGIGEKSIESVRQLARAHHISLWAATQHLIKNESGTPRSRQMLSKFIALIERFNEATEERSLEDTLAYIVEHSGLIEHYKKESMEKALTRKENLEELVNAARQHGLSFDSDATNPTMDFLSHAALEAGDQQAQKHEDCVQLMTLHSAKGLEFPAVYLTGLEEGLFPHERSTEDPEQLAEERRLCYVGITRAMTKLTITHAECRRLHGRESYPTLSRFLREIPAELISEVRMKSSRTPTPGAASYAPIQQQAMPFQLGQNVHHKKFGQGVVLQQEGSGKSARVQVNFSKAGCKWLVIAYAQLEAL